MNAPARVLVIAPQPTDAAWAAAAASARSALDRAVTAAVAAGHIQTVPLQPATAAALEAALTGDAFDIVHVIAHGSSRPAARYGTLTLEGSDGRARDLNAQNFARLCTHSAGLELVILHAVHGTGSELSVLCDTVLTQAVSVMTLPPTLSVDGAEQVLRTFYSGVATGDAIDTAFARAAGNPSSLPASAAARGANEPRLLVRSTPAPPTAPRRRSQQPAGAELREPRTDVAPIVPPTEPAGVSARSSAVQLELERKRLTGAFDVFLCHNVGDKPAVMDIGRRLMERGVLPWLDQWELRPGMPWQRLLEEQMASIAAAAVFVGNDGIGPWQRQELDGFLREFNTRGCPVIPVMLPGAGAAPKLPLFLQAMTWVDFRVADPDPLRQLIWGVTGKRPEVL